MRKTPLLISLLSFSFATAFSQQKPELSIERIMQDPKVAVGTSPSHIFWSEDSKSIYFDWNPEANSGDSLYQVAVTGGDPTQVTASMKMGIPDNGDYNSGYTEKVFSKNGDIFLFSVKSKKLQPITQTVAREDNPVFSTDDQKVFYTADDNLYSWEKATGKITQLTNFRNGEKKEEKDKPQQEWLKEQQLELMQIVRERKEKKDATEAYEEATKPGEPLAIYIGKKQVRSVSSNGDGKYITYVLEPEVDEKSTIVPNYVTESGYTEDIPARTKVGTPAAITEAWIYDTQEDTTYRIKTKDLPGLKDLTDFAKDYPDQHKKDTTDRPVFTHSPIWSENGQKAVVSFRSSDNKDRWIALLDPATGDVKVLDRQRDEAWIAGPGIGYYISTGELGWMPDNESIWFQSEETGYSHLYLLNTSSGEKTALTKGEFEIYEPHLSKDKKWWYFEANQQDPGIRQIFKLPANGGEMIQLSTMEGGYEEVQLSPDEKKIAFLYATATQPWELYVMDNKANAKATKLTHSTTKTFEEYPWRTPEYITFKAEDGAEVHARLYRPENPQAKGPAVVFVHGAGYLQNAHHWWSSYFREYMFHNLLADMGYTVLDMDYRGSAGYGRDWRTGIYRYMGGKDLSDQVDGARYLASEYNVDPKRIGLYGGSYGGFITLMAMFTEPDVFAAGAALRSVTDWAHYNHPYTANILNTPVGDSLAYAKSSPIYFAEGLKGALLMCHGMVDTNVHFQDIVRLTQRLIELKKENWELAVYPVENHGFVEPTSWMDEYKRILKLFEDNLK